uniref:Tetrapyrrole biosynthesis uroporphyrinogen III synthase domain-containing protein n=1 Tax=Bionectria ochroleuca TaxID=29856 RepID=A0A8H7NIC9_BIOOC
MASSDPPSVPILLLKTKSTPIDTYEELFSSSPVPSSGSDEARTSFSPQFVPVLQHRLEEPGVNALRDHLQNQSISPRAVEAFAKTVDEGKGDPSWPHLQDIPIYSVGPATTRALRAIPQAPKPLQVFGEHTGNGEVLSRFILDHYSEWYPSRTTKPALLFPVGEQRRDIIPKTLMDPSLPSDRRIEVAEKIVYGTGVMESFLSDFTAVLRDTADARERWVVVFSPTGCDSMLRGMGLLGEDGRVESGAAARRDGRTYVATIGPTTKQHLESKFGFSPDVSAETPSPEGILQAIASYRASKSN